MNKPSKAELAAAHGTVIDDLVAPELNVLFCGINPGLWSAATGFHFARPGNRFWPALHLSGFTPRLFDPSEQKALLGLGLGITNVVARATARADELTPEEFVAGGKRLVKLVHEWRPKFLAVVGLGAYRTAFGSPKATVGLQPETIGDTRVWVLPNPSGLNAHWQLPDLAAEFGRLRKASSQ
ncbi:G/U mismatch-specific DNA glycosylase [Kutzneria kofuensis]|uniref:TDG/mug DNA glycosylase family protein n=1 Tax=Kutzneria kofuensis TaxID=103725 RepID=A0A7W9KB35_9PSEU|nr:G/U mismatch-specific DNA glycosylase [Kutzneria kofuensis]MBB5889337.1 TDG/mug DNA glycosylase family protein [Kutzneria kofuensis]